VPTVDRVSVCDILLTCPASPPELHEHDAQSNNEVEMLRAVELLLGRASLWRRTEIHVLGVCVCVSVWCLCVCVAPSADHFLWPLTSLRGLSARKELPIPNLCRLPSLSGLTPCCRHQHLSPPPSPPPPPLHSRLPLPSDICSTVGFNTCHACAES
jgi:hypothetical protein